MATIWSSVLHALSMGRHDDFFDLGGHSLLATQVVARLSASRGVTVPIRLLFEFPVLGEFAMQVDELVSAKLLDAVADGGAQAESLLDELDAMPQGRVEQLLQEFANEVRPQ